MPILPFEIIEETINLLALDDPSFSSIKTCALVCHDFLHLCRKHIYVSVALNDLYAQPSPPFTGIIITTTPKLRELLDTSPEIAGYILNLTYNISSNDFNDESLVRTLRKITCLKYLYVRECNGRTLQWDHNPLRPVLLHLLHLPTLIHFNLFNVDNFIVSDLAPCINLQHLEFDYLTVIDANDTVVSNLPQRSIRIRSVSVGLNSAVAITKICVAHYADGRPFIDFSCLNELSVKLHRPDDVQASVDLFSHCRQLTSVEVGIQAWDGMVGLTEIGLSRMLSPSMQTLKHLHVNTSYSEEIGNTDPLCGLRTELEKMKNKNVVETIAIGVDVDTDSNCKRGDEWARLDTALAQPGWPKLQQISLAITIWSYERFDNELENTLRKLPQTQFPKLASSKSPLFKFSVREQCL